MTSSRTHRDNQRVLIEMWLVDLLDGDHAAAILFSQLLWWFQPAKGTTKPRVGFERQGHLWLVRSDADWVEDCRLSVRQVRRIRSVLVSKGLIEHKRFKWRGAPTSAWRPIFAAIPQDEARHLDSPEMTNPSDAQEVVGSDLPASLPKNTDLQHKPKASAATAASVKSRAILTEVCDAKKARGEPVPASFIGAMKVLESLVVAGWSESKLKAAAMRVPTITRPAMEFQLNGKGAGRVEKSADNLDRIDRVKRVLERNGQKAMGQ